MEMVRSKVGEGHTPSTIRINNQKIVLDVLRNSDTTTINDISKAIRLSKTTVWKIIDKLISDGLVVNAGKAESSDEGGKKPELFRFNNNYGYVITMMLGGSYILMALTDTSATIFYKEKISIKENENLESVISLISDFIRKWQQPNGSLVREKMQLLGIVMASSGVIDSDNGSCFTASRFASWQTNAPIRQLIEESVELKAPFYIENFNRYYAFAEKVIGCAKSYSNIVDLVPIHDGLGAGIIANDKIKRGPRFLTGEIGHMCINPFDDNICHCGGKGCFEQQISHERLVKKIEEGREENRESVIFKKELQSITLQDIFDGSNNGDAFCCTLVDELVHWFAIGLHNINLVFNPEIIIISGDYRNAGKYFIEKLNRQIESLSLVRMKKNLNIQYSDFDEDAPLLGGSSYVIQEYFSKYFQV